jgi:Shikimate kinase
LLNLALVGFMGSGKSTVGKQLAEELDLIYVDTDALVEAKAGMPIPEIFAKQGEAAFRELEREVVLELCRETHLVMATGGGAFINPSVREALLRSSLVAYLDAPFETLWERIRGDAGRPLLSGEGAYDRARALYQSRLPIYRTAHVTVDASRPADEVVRELLEVYHAHRRQAQPRLG